VVKLNGDLQGAGPVIITDVDFATYDRVRPDLAKRLLEDLKDNNALFIGLSFADPVLRRTVDWAWAQLTGEKRAHFVVVRSCTETERAVWRRKSIEPIEVGEWDRLPDLLAAIREHAGPSADQPALGRRDAGVGLDLTPALAGLVAKHWRGAIREAADLANEGRDEAALAAVRRLLEGMRQPGELSAPQEDLARAHRLAAQVAARVGGPDAEREADEHLRQAAELDPACEGSEAQRLARAIVASVLGKPDSARGLFDGLTGADADYNRFHFRLTTGDLAACDRMIEDGLVDISEHAQRRDEGGEDASRLAALYWGERGDVERTRQAIDRLLGRHRHGRNLQVASQALRRAAFAPYLRLCEEHHLIFAYPVFFDAADLVDGSALEEATEYSAAAAEWLGGHGASGAAARETAIAAALRDHGGRRQPPAPLAEVIEDVRRDSHEPWDALPLVMLAGAHEDPAATHAFLEEDWARYQGDARLRIIFAHALAQLCIAAEAGGRPIVRDGKPADPLSYLRELRSPAHLAYYGPLLECHIHMRRPGAPTERVALAAAALERARELAEPDNPEVLGAAVEIAVGSRGWSDQRERLLELTERLVRVARTKRTVQLRLDALIDGADPEGFLSELGRALADARSGVDEDSYFVRINRATAWLQLGVERERAEADLEWVLARAPAEVTEGNRATISGALLNLALLYRHANRYDEACRVLEEAHVKLDEDDPEFLCALAETMATSGRTDAAFARLKTEQDRYIGNPRYRAEVLMLAARAGRESDSLARQVAG